MKSPQEWACIVLAVVGMLLSLYALGLHYSANGESFCNISASFDCDKVNKSPWAKFMGIPVALLGAIAYLGLALLVLKRTLVEKLTSFTTEDFWQYVFLLTCVMLAFQLYLTFVEVYYLKAYCIVCLASQLIVLCLTILAGMLWKSSVRSAKE